MLTHKEVKARALECVDVKAEYDRLDEEFAFLDEFLKARAAAGVTQAEIANASAQHSPQSHVWNPAGGNTLHHSPPSKNTPTPSGVVLSCG